METPIVKVENLSHRYAIQWAIRDIDFEINKTGVYGLLGVNGSGKSTIMNIMCGVLKQTQGEVFIKGLSTTQNPVGAKKNIGFLPQQVPLYPDLTVEEYLTYTAYLRLQPKKNISKTVSSTMDKCGISHFRKRLVRNLSGGYQQRIGIAQAIIHNPSFVVLDEPTNGLDPNQILEIRKLIKEIAEENTVLLSTHILQEVQAICDHIWMINEGQQVFSGTMEEFDNYIVPNSLLISFANPPSLEELQKVSSVRQIEYKDNKSFVVHFDDADEVIDNIVNESVKNSWHLREIRREKTSMDSVFTELSRK
ncbi:ABC transporter ATP-binding protein [Proteiniphilum sp. UBA1028]|jgi:ABC-2 type transport system ATP-binding protein|uniref:ABC transporter ATP-binding protein n=1 Tax=Proteiniphilum sp. UBA1028 TaxID=1947251 RepID=UPI0025D0C76C|nr:ABC transporter ATP-binding protein [Proteiniphilum sp. UBA1028]